MSLLYSRNVYERPNANCSEKHDIHNSQKKELKTKGNIWNNNKRAFDSYTYMMIETYYNDL